MTEAKDLLAGIEELRDGQRLAGLPLETRLRNVCPACGCKLTEGDSTRALALVTGPPKRGKCPRCGWIGTK
jgi:hypothetical protein